MAETIIRDDEVDIVIAVIQPDISSFMEKWRPFFSRFHLIIVQDPDLQTTIQIPDGFNHNLYTKSDIDKLLSSSSSSTHIKFSGYGCRYFGYLMSSNKYIISIDDDCFPAKDEKTGFLINPIDQHLMNLKTPATPLFFNTLYDPYREGVDFVRGYPFSLREGVKCVLSCGLWLNLADLDAPTQALIPGKRNERYVDCVMTVPKKTLMPISGINMGFDREVMGVVWGPGLRLGGEGKVRWETMEDIWSGICGKVVIDHLGFGVKSGLPYVWRKESGDAVESLKKEWEGMKLMEEMVPFFQEVKLSETSITAEDCVVELANLIKKQLGSSNPLFNAAADSMVEWVRLWKTVRSSS